MKRREVITLIGAAATLVAASAAWAQQAGRTYRISIVADLPWTPRFQRVFAEFFDELRKQGFVEGGNLAVDAKFDIDTQHLDEVVAEVVRRAPDAIFCITLAALLAAQHATRTIPILAFEAQTGKEDLALARPERNTTGVTRLHSELDGKRQELLLEAVPHARHVAVLAEANFPNDLRAVRAAADVRGVELSVHLIAKPEEIDPAIAAAKTAGAEALNVLSSTMFYGSRQAIYDAAARARLPAIYDFPVTAREAGLIGYGPATEPIYRQLARQLAKIAQRREAGRYSHRAAGEIRAGDQSQDRKGAGYRDTGLAPRPRRRGDRMSAPGKLVRSSRRKTGPSKGQRQLGSECCVVTCDGGCEAYTAIAWGVGLSLVRSDIAGAEGFHSLEGNMCGTAMRGADAPPGSKDLMRNDRVKGALAG
jgi:putative ABC transport system substrate-binding protein